MPRWLLLMGAALLAGTLAAQEVEWESLDGPLGGSVSLVGLPDGSTYRGLGDVVERSTDGGLTWTDTGYPGEIVRSLDLGHDGSLLVARRLARAVRLSDGEWSEIGPESSRPSRAGADAAGVTYLLHGCTLWRSEDLSTWQMRVVQDGSQCRDIVVLPNGHLLLLTWNSVNWATIAGIQRSVDGGQSWIGTSHVELVTRLELGQHGGVFAIAPEAWDGTTMTPPRVYRWSDGAWEIISTLNARSVTTSSSGEVVLGLRHGFDEGPLAGPIAEPWALAEVDGGAWLAATPQAGLWRWTAAEGWYQIGGTAVYPHFLDRDRFAQLTVGVGASTLHHDGVRWRHGPWTRAIARSMAALPQRTLVASPGYSGEGIEGVAEPDAGVWDVEADQVLPVSPACADYEPCMASSLLDTGDAVFASTGGPILLCMPGDDRCLAGEFAGVFRSSDEGETWQAVLPGLANVCHLADSGSGVLWAAAGNRGMGLGDCPAYWANGQRVYRSNDNGLTWVSAGEGLPTPYATAVAAVPNGVLIGTAAHGVFRLGADDQLEAVGDLEGRVLSLGVSINGALLAGTKTGLFAHDGFNWRLLEFSGVPVHHVRVEDDGVVYVATSQGVYRTTAPLVVSTETGTLATVAALESIHPNPSRGEVTATFRLADTGTVKIAMYDLLGRRVAVLADGEYAAGSHAIRFDVGGVAAGVYVLELRAGGERWARRVTVIERF